MEKSESIYAKYNVLKPIRVSSAQDDLIKQKSLEQHCSYAEIVRTAINEYLNRNMSDAEIMHASLASNTQEIRYMENKLEIIMLMMMNLAREFLKKFPKDALTEDMAQKNFDLYMEKFTAYLSTKKGFLQALTLDAYETQNRQQFDEPEVEEEQ